MALEIGAVEQAFAPEDMKESEGECCIAAGKWLEIEFGLAGGVVADRIDDDLLGPGFGKPLLVGMRGRGGGVAAPDENTGGVLGGSRIEADRKSTRLNS